MPAPDLTELEFLDCWDRYHTPDLSDEDLAQWARAEGASQPDLTALIVAEGAGLSPMGSEYLLDTYATLGALFRERASPIACADELSVERDHLVTARRVAKLSFEDQDTMVDVEEHFRGRQPQLVAFLIRDIEDARLPERPWGETRADYWRMIRLLMTAVEVLHGHGSGGRTPTLYFEG